MPKGLYLCNRKDSKHSILILVHRVLGYVEFFFNIVRDYHLFSNLEKCTFCKETMIFLGFMVEKMVFM